MDPRVASGFYAPLKDGVRWLAQRRARGLRWEIQAVEMNEATLINISAWCESGGERVVVRRCRAERFEVAYDACDEPQAVRTSAITFSPSADVEVLPGGARRHWDARVNNHRLRQEASQGDLAATWQVYGSETSEVLAARSASIAKSQQRRATLIVRLLRALEPPGHIRVRVVFDLLDGQEVRTPSLFVPPQVPLHERTMAALCPGRC